VIRLTYTRVDAWCASYGREPEAVTIDTHKHGLGGQFDQMRRLSGHTRVA